MSSHTFQARVREWTAACFPPSVQGDVKERTHRFLEEAIELAQASNCTREDALALIDYVFSRPEGEPFQEAGGVLVTLAALCNAQEMDMDLAGEHELSRNWSRIDKIRAKQAAKPQGSALPQ
ncbi:hypothetical protein [Agrobacterium tumefaciens]|uniref:hypothetical protein n=1 Tax=Agrobacterium tumefaciens TaxID=358 RepID=UPI0021D0A9F5|nr:hypothetical protein [Agrobacterium tumefaciens]UXS24260.1 hypothetical protein FY153_07265 [Agrobacterium tumefaciens]UXS52426.1 hypothetical protein FY148_07070 [Agrobacterium tumefaciens]UXS62672.1 hypothetical protein FY147_07070 [Agrobacterium tumefaciens]